MKRQRSACIQLNEAVRAPAHAGRRRGSRDRSPAAARSVDAARSAVCGAWGAGAFGGRAAGWRWSARSRPNATPSQARARQTAPVRGDHSGLLSESAVPRCRAPAADAAGAIAAAAGAGTASDTGGASGQHGQRSGLALVSARGGSTDRGAGPSHGVSGDAGDPGAARREFTVASYCGERGERPPRWPTSARSARHRNSPRTRRRWRFSCGRS